ncbi:No apical meristem (NAM) protein, partial [Corchorus capsularis]
MTENLMPYGVRFCPDEKEVIFSHYLCPRIKGEPTPYAFKEIDIYKKEPWNLFEWNKDSPQTESFWVFTRLRRKGGSKTDRVAGCGSWNNKGKRNDVMDSKGRLLGYERYFIFTAKKDSLKWMMHEYSVQPEGSSNLVLCEIKYELVGKKRKSCDDLGESEEGSSSTVKKIGLDLDCQNKPVPVPIISQNKNMNNEVILASQNKNMNNEVILEELPVELNHEAIWEELPVELNHEAIWEELPVELNHAVTYELNPVVAVDDYGFPTDDPIYPGPESVDPGKPASFTWQRQLNSICKPPVAFGMSFQEIRQLTSIFDIFRKHFFTADHGIPLGGMGAGSIGRGFRGEFQRFKLFPKVCEKGPILANQFSAFVSRPNGQKYSTVLCARSPEVP